MKPWPSENDYYSDSELLTNMERGELRSAGFAFMGAMLCGLYQIPLPLPPPKPPWCSRCGGPLRLVDWLHDEAAL